MATYTYTMGELLTLFRKYYVRRELPMGSTMADVYRLGSGDDGGDAAFKGGTVADVESYIAQGYTFPRMSDESLLPTITDSEQSHFYWTDDSYDSEYSYAEDEAGEPDYYLKRSQEQSKVGIRIRVQMGFSGGYPAAKISEYGLWVAEVVKSMETNGHDVELTIYTHHTDRVRGEHETVCEVKCKEFGETGSLRDYGAVFAPGGYRWLCHFMYTLPELEGKTVSIGLGAPTRPGYAVTWDSATRTMNITQGRREVNYDKLNADLKRIHDSETL